MHFPDLTVGKEDDPKGRTFTVHYVASIHAARLVPPAGNGTLRPLLLAYAGSSSSVRAFTANLRCGLTATTRDRRFELLRSLGYRYQLTSPAPGAALAIAYLPDLFHLQPGVQSDDILRFVSAPPVWWLARQEQLMAPKFGSLARDHALAMDFVARVDARTPLPIVNDPAFHRALFVDALTEAWTQTGADRDVFAFDGIEALGLANPVLCDVSRQAFSDFLAAATAKHLTRDQPPALPLAPARIATQLTFDFLSA